MSSPEKIIFYRSLELLEQQEITCKIKGRVGNRLLVELSKPLGESKYSECLISARYRGSLFPYFWFGKVIVNTFVVEKGGDLINGSIKHYDIGEVRK